MPQSRRSLSSVMRSGAKSLVAGHQPDLPLSRTSTYFPRGEAVGRDAYGQVTPTGFEDSVDDHRIAVLDVVVY